MRRITENSMFKKYFLNIECKNCNTLLKKVLTKNKDSISYYCKKCNIIPLIRINILDNKKHLGYLDGFSGNELKELTDEYKKLYNKYNEIKRELKANYGDEKEKQRKLDLLQYQINEIEEAQIQNENEDNELEQELEVLNNAEKLKELTGSAYWAINGDDGSIIESLTRIKSDISKASGYDSKLEEVNSDFANVSETLREIASFLRDYSQNLDNDTQRLNEIQERLFLLDKLKRKYGGTLEDVLKTYSKVSEELSGIEYSTKNVQDLENKISEYEIELNKIASIISEHRKNYAKVLSSLIEDKLAVLELPKAKFEIKVEDKPLSYDGADNVEFMISTNVSEDLKPLSKVASGGEISRVMLAIKSIFAQNDEIDTVIFDEIDTGISGHAAQSVADEIELLSKSHQVIVITHQPIIASKADKHFYVRKSQQDMTKVEVFVLTGDNRIKAIAELAGGDINEQSVEFAKSLLAK